MGPVPENLDPRLAASCRVPVGTQEEITDDALVKMIKRHFNLTKIDNHYVRYTANELFHSQPMLIEIDVPVNIVGDIHGQFLDMMQIFNTIGYPHNQNYLFLGDYIDRGPHHLEVISLLLCYKCLYPTNIYLLRGNHEWAQINHTYGFYDEIKARIPGGNDATRIYRRFNDLFGWLPVTAVVGSRILCMHGGISPNMTFDDIRNLKRPLHELKGLACDLLWADPETDLEKSLKMTERAAEFAKFEAPAGAKLKALPNHLQPNYGPNTIRGMSVVFNEKAVQELTTRLKLDLVCRAHQVVLNGYEFYANRKLVTIFSAPKYCNDFDNIAAVMCVDANYTCSFRLFKPSLPE